MALIPMCVYVVVFLFNSFYCTFYFQCEFSGYAGRMNWDKFNYFIIRTIIFVFFCGCVRILNWNDYNFGICVLVWYGMVSIQFKQQHIHIQSPECGRKRKEYEHERNDLKVAWGGVTENHMHTSSRIVCACVRSFILARARVRVCINTCLLYW